MRNIEYIVVHCSDSPDDGGFTAADVRRWHTSRDPKDPSKPWGDIGYHRVVERDGTVSPGRPIEKPGAHVKGYNTASIGICMMGRTRFTPEQYAALAELLRGFCGMFPAARVCGHRDLTRGKTCPNDEIHAWLTAGRWRA